MILQMALINKLQFIVAEVVIGILFVYSSCIYFSNNLMCLFRFLLPPWSEVKLESKELMSACLKKIPGLSKVKLIDAAWIWTEPHSMRLKIKLTVQKEIMNGAVLQQTAVVDFTIRNQQCTSCQSSFAQGAWQAVVQVRQRVSHKRTFYFLEQLLLKHHAHSECINIVVSSVS